jgi:hypothetical protein
MHFRRNHIHHTGSHGEGFYLGVNNAKDGSTPGYIFNSIIEQNYIHDLKGPRISQGDGIEIKDGSFNNIVRDNVIHDTNYPGVLVYGTDGKAPNIVERNVIWNTGDHGIQAASEAVIRNNIIWNPGADGIYSNNHQSALPGKLKIVHNTVVAYGRGHAALRLNRPPGGFSGPIVIANNAFYNTQRGHAIRAVSDPLITWAGNAGNGTVSGLELVDDQYRGVGDLKRDLAAMGPSFPGPQSILAATAAKSFLARDDFNGDARGKALDVGAYKFSASGNPGWKVGEGFKKVSSE